MGYLVVDIPLDNIISIEVPFAAPRSYGILCLQIKLVGIPHAHAVDQVLPARISHPQSIIRQLIGMLTGTKAFHGIFITIQKQTQAHVRIFFRAEPPKQHVGNLICGFVQPGNGAVGKIFEGFFVFSGPAVYPAVEVNVPEGIGGIGVAVFFKQLQQVFFRQQPALFINPVPFIMAPCQCRNGCRLTFFVKVHHEFFIKSYRLIRCLVKEIFIFVIGRYDMEFCGICKNMFPAGMVTVVFKGRYSLCNILNYRFQDLLFRVVDVPAFSPSHRLGKFDYISFNFLSATQTLLQLPVQLVAEIIDRGEYLIIRLRVIRKKPFIETSFYGKVFIKNVNDQPEPFSEQPDLFFSAL